MIVGAVGGTIEVMLTLLPGLLLALAPPVLPDSTSQRPSEPAPAAESQPDTASGPGGAPTEMPAEGEPVPEPPPETSGPLPMQPAEPSPEVEPPQPDPVAETSTEVAPAPVADVEQPLESRGPDEALHGDYVRVQRPRHNGTGMFITAGVTFGAAALVQSLDSLAFGDSSLGILERMFLATSMGMAAGGGIRKGHADAYDDTVFGRERPKTRKILVAGVALTAVGATLGLVNEGLWWSCVFNDDGPYAIEPDPDSFRQFDCRSGLTRGLLDLSSGATAAGLGMMTWALVYRRDARAYEGARVISLRPRFGRGYAGLSVGGRF